MAHMIPPTPPPPGPGSRAEGALYAALEAGLDDEHFVYHNLCYIERSSAREGQADIVVLHRQHGLLVIECKGGGVRRGRDGKWTRTVGSGQVEELRRSPWQQAQDQVRTLVRELSKRARKIKLASRFPLPFGFAVAFPLAEMSAEDLSPLDIPAETVLDAGDLDDVATWVERCYAFWRNAAGSPRGELSEAIFRQLRRKVLHPALNVVPTLSAAIRAERQALIRMTMEQAGFLERLLVNRRIAVRGSAGTGKTVMAVEAAKRLAEKGSQVLLLCFNKALGAHLRAVLKLDPPAPGAVEALHFHQLCRRAFDAVNMPFEVPDAAHVGLRRHFWERTTPVVLFEAFEAGALEPYDAILVDEAQDFAPDWWPAIEAGLGDQTAGHLLVFYDPAQNIFRATPFEPGDEFMICPLTLNLRNTRQIAELVHRLGHIDRPAEYGCPEGEAPELRSQKGPRHARTQIDELVRHMLAKQGMSPEQIVVLTPHSRPNSCLSGATSLGGVSLTDTQGQATDAIVHTTIGAFKGLEADVVILADIHPSDPRCSRKELYVATSRARHRLILFGPDGWLDAVAREGC